MNFRHSIMAWLLRDPLSHHVLHADLVSARFGVTLEQYLWKCLRIAILAGIFFGILGYLVGRFFAIQIAAGKGIYNVLDLRVPDGLSFLFGPLALEIAGAAVAFLIGAYVVWALLMRWPAIEKKNRSVRINLTLHNAVAYMYAMRKGGAQLTSIFTALSEHAQTYGEVAFEFRQVVRDVDYFGADVVSAIRHLSETTPSGETQGLFRRPPIRYRERRRHDRVPFKPGPALPGTGTLRTEAVFNDPLDGR
jgi:Bacterial type II secretion system protein F domain.